MNRKSQRKHACDPAERLWEFLKSPASRSVVDRYEAWAQTPGGIAIMSHLHAVAALRLEGLLTRRAYEAAMAELAHEVDLPLSDLLVMAKGAYEVKRCSYLATARLLGGVAADWTHEDGRQ